MNASHVAGGAIGLALAAVVVALVRRYASTTFSDTDATLIGGAAVAIGVGIAHAVWQVGLGPIFSRILHGPSATGAARS